MPATASIPQPVGEAEQTATEAFLNWVATALDWGRDMARRAGIAREACTPH